MNHPRTLGPIARRLALRGLVALALFAGSEEHTSELQSPYDLVCRLLLEKKKNRCYRKQVRLIQSNYASTIVSDHIRQHYYWLDRRISSNYVHEQHGISITTYSTQPSRGL